MNLRQHIQKKKESIGALGGGISTRFVWVSQEGIRRSDSPEPFSPAGSAEGFLQLQIHPELIFIHRFILKFTRVLCINM